uniref:EF-hand domain-containing protein n=1 Tax=Hucho hucho TaxID=62062 RepID=A0A4W5PPG7_9TELE
MAGNQGGDGSPGECHYALMRITMVTGVRLNEQPGDLEARRGSTRDIFADMTIDFDNFVACVMRLEMMFKVFKKLDMDDSGFIELDFYQVRTLNRSL